MLDNYDSFTHNRVQYCGELGHQALVKRNDEITTTEIDELKPQCIVISPGPCSPKESGISIEVIKTFAGRTPILGVCLGHQCIAHAYGGQVVRANQVMHGKTSPIFHADGDVFRGLNQPFTATRYHSLIVEKATLPEELVITAWTKKANGEVDEIMGLKHRSKKLYGVQFHPEAILTEQGHELLANFLDISLSGASTLETPSQK